MSSYPDGHFIEEFARRTQENFNAMRTDERLRWQDTALISFLLAVFVLPHERPEQDTYMGDLLKSYPNDLENVVEILRTEPKDGNEPECGPPTSLEQLPKYLRNAVSHFNIRPESKDGQNLTHLLIWNKIPENYKKNGGKISFVAKVNIEGLRSLAMYVLNELAKGKVSDRYEDKNPIAQFDDDWR